MNYKKISQIIYLADNQNGFNQSLYDYFECNSNESNYSKKDIRKMIQNFPTKYPCVFAIIDKVFECNRIYIDIVEPFVFDELNHGGYKNI